MRKHLLLLGLSVGLISSASLAQDCSNGRYYYNVSETVEMETVKYGQNYGQNGTTMEELYVDIYTPAGDTDTERPLVLLAHGGSFIGGNKSDIADLCKEFAKKGYVAASMQYRLINNMFDQEFYSDMGYAFQKEVVRAYHDMRAAIRFFRKSVDEGNPYGINPDIIITGGVSAGAILSNHVTYMDDISKVPDNLLDYVMDQGGVEGNTGNEGYSSESMMSLSWCGAILDTTWIETKPYAGFHTEGDIVVPNIEGQPNIAVTVPVTLQGDSLMYRRAVNIGLPSIYKLYPGDDHCGFDMPETVQMTLAFVFEQLCPEYLSLSENGKTYFSVYPNPADESFFVDVPGNANDWDVSITNMLGQEVYSTSIDSFSSRVEVQSSSFTQGVYLVNLISKEGKKSTKKLVIK